MSLGALIRPDKLAHGGRPMVKPVKVDAKGKRADFLARQIATLTDQGREVVLVISDPVPPERVVKIIQFAQGNLDIQLIVRHAELQEYLTNALAGVAIGAGVGVAGVLAAVAAGNPITAGPVLAAIGLGALIGAAMGTGATPMAQLIVYKHRGETRLKFSPAC